MLLCFVALGNRESTKEDNISLSLQGNSSPQTLCKQSVNVDEFFFAHIAVFLEDVGLLISGFDHIFSQYQYRLTLAKLNAEI